jgi:hypothetical protein
MLMLMLVIEDQAGEGRKYPNSESFREQAPNIEMRSEDRARNEFILYVGKEQRI